MLGTDLLLAWLLLLTGPLFWRYPPPKAAEVCDCLHIPSLHLRRTNNRWPVGCGSIPKWSKWWYCPRSQGRKLGNYQVGGIALMDIPAYIDRDGHMYPSMHIDMYVEKHIHIHIQLYLWVTFHSRLVILKHVLWFSHSERYGHFQSLNRFLEVLKGGRNGPGKAWAQYLPWQTSVHHKQHQPAGYVGPWSNRNRLFLITHVVTFWGYGWICRVGFVKFSGRGFR